MFFNIFRELLVFEFTFIDYYIPCYIYSLSYRLDLIRYNRGLGV